VTYVDTLLSYGIPIVFGWVFAGQAGVPIPTVPLLLAVGALGALRKLSLGWALLTALGGSIVADLLWFGVGRCWGDGALRVGAVGRARELFLAHRLRALVIGKFLFGMNAAVAALAGSSRNRCERFSSSTS
jgi:membrane protein DedA with SNARE-associated domain